MSQDHYSYDDEIDLFALLTTLWDGKWLIVSYTVLASLIGFGYSQAAQSKYNVSVPYSLNNIDSFSKNTICPKNDNCLAYLLSTGWTKDKKKLSLKLSTKSPLDITEYESQLEHANKVKTNEIYMSAKENVLFIKAELKEYLSILKTELPENYFIGNVGFRQILQSKKIIQSIDNGNTALTFGPIFISKISPKVPLILIISAMLGGILGSSIILIRSAILNRKKN